MLCLCLNQPRCCAAFARNESGFVCVWFVWSVLTGPCTGRHASTCRFLRALLSPRDRIDWSLSPSSANSWDDGLLGGHQIKAIFEPTETQIVKAFHRFTGPGLKLWPQAAENIQCFHTASRCFSLSFTLSETRPANDMAKLTEDICLETASAWKSRIQPKIDQNVSKYEGQSVGWWLMYWIWQFDAPAIRCEINASRSFRSREPREASLSLSPQRGERRVRSRLPTPFAAARCHLICATEKNDLGCHS